MSEEKKVEELSEVERQRREERKKKIATYEEHRSETAARLNGRPRKSKNRKCPCGVCREVRSSISLGSQVDQVFKSRDGQLYKVLAGGMLVKAGVKVD